MAKDRPMEPPARVVKICELTPDDLALEIEQRPTGVTRVDGHVGLDEGHVILPAAGRQLRPLALTIPAVTE
jgi:hypothetical protein